ncbi:vWA domain-containing protein [Alsobacter sp. SYSU BS001988]
MAAPVNKAAALRVTRARSALIAHHAFYASLALQMRMVERSDIETMATDGRAIYYNPEFVLANSEPETIGTIVHEVEHCARLHHVRRGRRDLARWNEACDYAINPDLMRGGFVLWKGAYNEPRFYGMSAEEIYRALTPPEPDRKPEDKAKAGQPGAPGPGAPGAPGGPGKPADAGQPGQGAPGAPGGPADAGGPPSGPGAAPGAPGGGPGKPDRVTGVPDPGRCGGIIDAAPDFDAAAMEAEAQEWTARVRQAAMVARAAGAGNLPGYVQEIIADLDTAAARVDWRAELRRFADESTVRDTSWSRPNRRFAWQGVTLPGSVAIAPSHLVAVVDTSGSMDRAALRAIAAELQSILDEGAAERVTIIDCDTRVNAAETFATGDTIRADFKGRGGTKFSPAFAWIEEHAPDASAILYLTDLDCRDFGPEPAAPVLWAQTDAAARSVPFGDIIRVDPNA